MPQANLSKITKDMQDISYDDSPIVHLIAKDMTQMNEEELRKHVNTLRLLRSSAQTRRANIRTGKKTVPTVSQEDIEKYLAWDRSWWLYGLQQDV